MKLPELGTLQPTTGTIDDWKVNIFNCNSRVGWYKVTARRGSIVLIKDRLTPEQVQAFNPTKESKK